MNKWTRVALIGLFALLFLFLIARVLFWHDILDIFSPPFIRGIKQTTGVLHQQHGTLRDDLHVERF
jgi:hypothetical protein